MALLWALSSIGPLFTSHAGEAVTVTGVGSGPGKQKAVTQAGSHVYWTSAKSITKVSYDDFVVTL
ncbi:MAG TPA: hypothetical protein VHD83_11735 [Puia sp.]|nr:hypothetical protein [Puia sp.]